MTKSFTIANRFDAAPHFWYILSVSKTLTEAVSHRAVAEGGRECKADCMSRNGLGRCICRMSHERYTPVKACICHLLPAMTAG